ncbi:hypothetical protein BRADI_3g22778v3 [Brachypodium distachyon]|uniref:Uncharacterized protein n=1 Tax=Brachypodium distachyon TaxID=15368 RepID=A0A0Q3FAN5_BRADI|nr:hypothetical protein BRADI_3g22778v3 [Brachypodium distachyon]
MWPRAFCHHAHPPAVPLLLATRFPRRALLPCRLCAPSLPLAKRTQRTETATKRSRWRCGGPAGARRRPRRPNQALLRPNRWRREPAAGGVGGAIGGLTGSIQWGEGLVGSTGGSWRRAEAEDGRRRGKVGSGGRTRKRRKQGSYFPAGALRGLGWSRVGGKLELHVTKSKLLRP